MRILPYREWNILAIFFSGLCSFLFNAAPTKAQLWDVPPLPAVQYVAAPDGMTATIGTESVHISVCGASIIHFVAAPESHSSVARSQPWMLDPKEACPGAKFQLAQTPDAAVITTDTLKIEFSVKRGNVQFSTNGGEVLLRERDSVPRTYEPVELNGETTFHVEDRFAPDATEGFYRVGAASEWNVQLPGCDGCACAEQYGRRDSAAVIDKGLRVNVEHSFANVCR